MPPSTSERQATMFRIALAKKKGAKIKGSGPAERIARTLSAAKIREFTQVAKK